MGLLEVGRIAKSHGLRGELAVRFTTDRVAERTASDAVFLVAFDGPDRPDEAKTSSDGWRNLVVRKGQPHGKGWLLKFAGVDSREAADLLRGKVLYAEPLDDLDDDVVFVHELIGCRLIDQQGVDHGPVLSVIENPASDLLELADDVLVPLTFLVEVEKGKVHVDVPEGLLGESRDIDGDDDAPQSDSQNLDR